VLLATDVGQTAIRSCLSVSFDFWRDFVQTMKYKTS